MNERFKKLPEDLAAPKTGMIATGGVLEVIIENASLSVSKSDFY
jgi:hypothetical protein